MLVSGFLVILNHSVLVGERVNGVGMSGGINGGGGNGEGGLRIGGDFRWGQRSNKVHLRSENCPSARLLNHKIFYNRKKKDLFFLVSFCPRWDPAVWT